MNLSAPMHTITRLCYDSLDNLIHNIWLYISTQGYATSCVLHVNVCLLMSMSHRVYVPSVRMSSLCTYPFICMSSNVCSSVCMSLSCACLFHMHIFFHVSQSFTRYQFIFYVLQLLKDYTYDSQSYFNICDRPMQSAKHVLTECRTHTKKRNRTVGGEQEESGLWKDKLGGDANPAKIC